MIIHFKASDDKAFLKSPMRARQAVQTKYLLYVALNIATTDEEPTPFKIWAYQTSDRDLTNGGFGRFYNQTYPSLLEDYEKFQGIIRITAYKYGDPDSPWPIGLTSNPSSNVLEITPTETVNVEWGFEGLIYKQELDDDEYQDPYLLSSLNPERLSELEKPENQIITYKIELVPDFGPATVYYLANEQLTNRLYFYYDYEYGCSISGSTGKTLYSPDIISSGIFFQFYYNSDDPPELVGPAFTGGNIGPNDCVSVMSFTDHVFKTQENTISIQSTHPDWNAIEFVEFPGLVDSFTLIDEVRLPPEFIDPEINETIVENESEIISAVQYSASQSFSYWTKINKIEFLELIQSGGPLQQLIDDGHGYQAAAELIIEENSSPDYVSNIVLDDNTDLQDYFGI